MKDNLTDRNIHVQSLINLIPKKIRLILNPTRYFIENFVRKSSAKIEKGSRVLDAGAGPQPYKSLFNHCNYESTDIKDPNKALTFVCSLDNIPKEDNYYDAIISTAVLEHVEFPQKTINEFYRVLKKDGKLFMTVPQGWKLHQEPYNFFNFTKYGIESLLKNAGFKNFKIIAQGGYFLFLSDAIRFNGILEQYKKYFPLYYPLKIIEFPLTNIILPFVLFFLDFLDKEKKWTLGYLVEANK